MVPTPWCVWFCKNLIQYIFKFKWRLFSCIFAIVCAEQVGKYSNDFLFLRQGVPKGTHNQL